MVTPESCLLVLVEDSCWPNIRVFRPKWTQKMAPDIILATVLFLWSKLQNRKCSKFLHIHFRWNFLPEVEVKWAKMDPKLTRFFPTAQDSPSYPTPSLAPHPSSQKFVYYPLTRRSSYLVEFLHQIFFQSPPKS